MPEHERVRGARKGIRKDLVHNRLGGGGKLETVEELQPLGQQRAEDSAYMRAHDKCRMSRVRGMG